MAKCEKREMPQPRPPVEYVLTLDREEARALRVLLLTAAWPSGASDVVGGIFDAINRAGAGL